MRIRILLMGLFVVIIFAGIIFALIKDVKTAVKDVPPNTNPPNYQAEYLWTDEDTPPSGAGSGVAIANNGDILYLHRAGYSFNNDEIIPQATLFRFDGQTHELIDQWGADVFKSPHGLAVDAEDNVWITDIKLNQIFKFSPKGELLKTFGDPYPFYLEICLQIRNKLNRLPCTNNPAIFARPTDIVINKQGEFVVTDGYRNSRLVKFNAEGQLVWESGRLGNEDGEFYLPHGLAMDAQERLYVADRKNGRVQQFSPDGKWLATWDQPELGRPFALEVSEDQILYIVDGGDTLDAPDYDQNERSQIIKMDLDGNIIERWGSFGPGLGEMDLPHDIAIAQDGTVFVAEINNGRVQQFTRLKD